MYISHTHCCGYFGFIPSVQALCEAVQHCVYNSAYQTLESNGTRK